MSKVKHHMHIVGALLLWLGLAGYAVSSTTEFEAFDFGRCLHWAISSDSYNTIQPAETRRFHDANAKMTAHLGSASDGSDWSIFSAHEFPGGSTEGKYGACRQTRAGHAFECLAGFDFPLSGKKFFLARSKGQLPTLRCTVGCNGPGIKALHDMGYENMEGEENVEQQQLAKRFERLCPVGIKK